MTHLDNVAALKSALKCCTILLVLKVLASILSNYSDYFPPNFESNFLQGRKEHFLGAYRLAFYAHILSTPCALISGLILMNVLRLISGTASFFYLNSEWVYPIAAWACWIVPLLGLELYEGAWCKA